MLACQLFFKQLFHASVVQCQGARQMAAEAIMKRQLILCSYINLLVKLNTFMQ